MSDSPTMQIPRPAGDPAASEQMDAAAAHREAIRAFGQEHYDALSASRKRNGYFHRCLTRIVAHHVLPDARVLDIGCGRGDMLAALRPAHGVGIDVNAKALADGRAHHPHLHFHELSAENLAQLPGSREGFDYVILSGVLPQFYDLHTVLEAIRGVCHERTRLIICTFSRLWQPAIRLGELLGWKARVPDESWIPSHEVGNLIAQCDFEVVRQVDSILLPVGIPVVSDTVNRWLSPLPGVHHLSLCTISVARMLSREKHEHAAPSVSIIVPARNEAGNIRTLLERVPPMAAKQEVIFVEGHSTDNTWETIQAVVEEYKSAGGAMALQAVKQAGKGKGDAVRAGFALATGEIVMILDADISVPPEELPRFVELLVRGHCEFANGSRLVYPMEKKAMRFLNMLANKSFGWMFTYLLGQSIRDTLCGTKVLRRADYEKIAANRDYFGDFDPFGDFDLLFGAARMNLKIVDVPVHYKQRVYGETNISRFRHGWMLLRMCGVAARKIRFV